MISRRTWYLLWVLRVIVILCIAAGAVWLTQTKELPSWLEWTIHLLSTMLAVGLGSSPFRYREFLRLDERMDAARRKLAEEAAVEESADR